LSDPDVEYKRQYGHLLAEAGRLGRLEYVRDHMADLSDSEITELENNTQATSYDA
jgi:hypothetical protein